ncbi:hypothetical protein PRIPAC_92372 [Pristionchus pacificus]|uniref:Uncharacterized protein n=1 Tax=Pristionchus pacificus TaxID=54126 RepID=A0A2A6BBD6_PRIPA|nr:hypothetical protein PRIPAC_92372 [Pristionchus pacificus]|eukprot:PDM63195.1 hypothetical protein PRIPAC_50410 [Pristionchus pacificus]
MASLAKTNLLHYRSMDLPPEYHSYMHDSSDPFMEEEMEESDEEAESAKDVAAVESQADERRDEGAHHKISAGRAVMPAIVHLDASNTPLPSASIESGADDMSPAEVPSVAMSTIVPSDTSSRADDCNLAAVSSDCPTIPLPGTSTDGARAASIGADTLRSQVDPIPASAAAVDTPSTVTIALSHGITLQFALPRSAADNGQQRALDGLGGVNISSTTSINGPFSITINTVAGPSAQVQPTVVSGTSALALAPSDSPTVPPAVASTSAPNPRAIAAGAHASGTVPPPSGPSDRASKSAVVVPAEEVAQAVTPDEDELSAAPGTSSVHPNVDGQEDDTPAEDTAQMDDDDDASASASLAEASNAAKPAKKRKSSFCRICKVLLTKKPTAKLLCCGVAVHWSCAVYLLEKQASWSEQKCPECEEHVSALKHDGCDRTVAIFPYGDSGERLPTRYSVLRLANASRENIEELLKRFQEATKNHGEVITNAPKPDSRELIIMQKRNDIFTEMLTLYEKGGMRVESFSVEEEPRPWDYTEELLLQRHDDERLALKRIAIELRRRAQQLEDEVAHDNANLPVIKAEIEVLKKDIEAKRLRPQVMPAVSVNSINGDDDDVEFLFEQKATSPTSAPSMKRKSLSSATCAPSRRSPKTTSRVSSMQPRAQHTASPLLLTERSIGTEAPSEVPSTTHVPMHQTALIEQPRRADSESHLMSQPPPRESSMKLLGALESRESIASDELEEEISNGSIVATPQGWKRSNDEASSHSVNGDATNKDISNSHAGESSPSRRSPDNGSASPHINETHITIDDIEYIDVNSPFAPSGSVGGGSAAGIVLDGSEIMEVYLSPQRNKIIVEPHRIPSSDDETSSPSSLDRSVSPSGSESTSQHDPLDEGTDSPLPPSTQSGSAAPAAREASTSPHCNIDCGNSPSPIDDEEETPAPSSVAASHGCVASSPNGSDNTVPYVHLDEERSSSLQPSSSHDGTTLTPVALETSSKGGCGADGDSTLSKQSSSISPIADPKQMDQQRKQLSILEMIEVVAVDSNGMEQDKPVDVATLLQSASSLQCLLQASSSSSHLKKADVDSCPKISGVEKETPKASSASGSNGPLAAGVSPNVILDSSVITSSLLDEARRIITEMNAGSSGETIGQLASVNEKGSRSGSEAAVDETDNEESEIVRSARKESAAPKRRHSTTGRAQTDQTDSKAHSATPIASYPLMHASVQAIARNMSNSSLNDQTKTIVLVPPPFTSSRARNFGQLPLRPIIVPIEPPESTKTIESTMVPASAASSREPSIQFTLSQIVQRERSSSKPNGVGTTSKEKKSWKDEAEKRRLENRIKARAERKAKEGRTKLKKEKKEKDARPRPKKTSPAEIAHQSSTQLTSLSNPVNATSRAASMGPTASNPSGSPDDTTSPTVLDAPPCSLDDTAQPLTTPIVPVKRGRGRPKGSSNKKKERRSKWDSDESDDEYVPGRSVHSKRSTKSEQRDPLPVAPPAKIARLSAVADESDDEYVTGRQVHPKRSAKSEQRDPLPLPSPAKIARRSVAADEERIDYVPSMSALPASIVQHDRVLTVTERSFEETLTYISL